MGRNGGFCGLILFRRHFERCAECYGVGPAPNEACIKFGKKLDIAAEHKQELTRAGFKNVREETFKVCLGLSLTMVYSAN
jgi:hypothetical protein